MLQTRCLVADRNVFVSRGLHRRTTHRRWSLTHARSQPPAPTSCPKLQYQPTLATPNLFAVSYKYL